MSRLFRLALIALGCIAIASHDTARAQGNTPTEISVAVSSTSIAIASLRLAEKLGIFEKHGLKPRFIVAENSNAATAALLGGSVDFATPTMEEILTLRAQGQQAVGIVVNVYRGISGVVVVRKEVADKLPAKPSDAPEARIKALDGLLLAGTSPTSGMVGPLRMAFGMFNTNVRMTYMQLTAMVPAMKTDAIQAFIASSPYWEQAVEAGIAVQWLSGPQGEFPESTVTAVSATVSTTRTYAERNPDTVRRFRAAYSEFAAMTRERPADVLNALKQLFPDLSPRVAQLAFEQNAPAWTRPDVTDAELRREIDMRKGAIPNIEKIEPTSLVLPR